MSHQRQDKIRQLLELKGEVQLQELKNFFPGVSIMTLRRDLISLSDEGFLIRTHGGAVSAKRLASTGGEEDPYSERAMEQVAAKMRIADIAVNLVEKERAVFFDSGSTLMCLAKKLPDAPYSIITSGANIALELLKKTRITVSTVGGQLNRNTLSFSGPHAEAILDMVNIDLAFMASSGFSLRSGFTVSNIYECQLKQKVLKRAKKAIVLVDTSKINKDLPFTYAGLKDITAWVVEGPLPAEVEAEARRCGTEVIY